MKGGAKEVYSCSQRGETGLLILRLQGGMQSENCQSPMKQLRFTLLESPGFISASGFSSGLE